MSHQCPAQCGGTLIAVIPEKEANMSGEQSYKIR
jgi:hypothetical protein